MTLVLILVFILGYTIIVLEGFISINKAASALLCGVLCWVVFITGQSNIHEVLNELLRHLSDIAGVLFFLMGAMAIVELIDAHDGFAIINKLVRFRNKRAILWVLALITFFLSAILDNLTTTIVMIILARKLIYDNQDRLVTAGMIVIAANAGGAWSPIGDVTTTMLWIADRISTFRVIENLLLPSLVSLLVPLFISQFFLSGNIKPTAVSQSLNSENEGTWEGTLILLLGIAVLLLVPVFKYFTHLPPFMGMFAGLSSLWIVTEILHRKKDRAKKEKYSVGKALQRMDMPSVLFFLGILLSVSSLESAGVLSGLATEVRKVFQSMDIFAVLIGMISSVFGNIPLIAASIGMFTPEMLPKDHSFWHMLAYSAGTGSSILIIGSAAGVVAMGLEKVSFFWYLKRFSILALLGYFGGIAVYWLL